MTAQPTRAGLAKAPDMDGARQLSGRAQAGPIDGLALLGALPTPVFLIDGDDRFGFLNAAAEQFFDAGATVLSGRHLNEVVSADSPLLSLVAQARQGKGSLAEHGVALESPRIGQRFVALELAPVAEIPGAVIVLVHELSIARRIDRQLTHRHAARSVSAMAAMLAHEIKNPLSGIRGAAQLLEQTIPPDEHPLTRLICEETDRIVALVDRVEMFADDRPIERLALNIHEVLQQVRTAAIAGFARHVRIFETYDPSLPPVLGNRDLLIQAFLNLVKNAAEAVPAHGGEIHLSTRYQPGIRLALPGSESRHDLPLVVTIQDNGQGIPEDLRPHLFDPFVTTKTNGKGLGLALVAKIVGEHGGIVEFDSEPRRTIFAVHLPTDRSGERS